MLSLWFTAMKASDSLFSSLPMKRSHFLLSVMLSHPKTNPGNNRDLSPPSPQGAIMCSDCNCSSFLSAGRLSEIISVHSLHEKAVFLHRKRYSIRLQISECELTPFPPTGNSKWQLSVLFFIIIIVLFSAKCLSCENIGVHWALRNSELSRFLF